MPRANRKSAPPAASKLALGLLTIFYLLIALVLWLTLPMSTTAWIVYGGFAALSVAVVASLPRSRS